jgi:hypothetical protein
MMTTETDLESTSASLRGLFRNLGNAESGSKQEENSETPQAAGLPLAFGFSELAGL